MKSEEDRLKYCPDCEEDEGVQALLKRCRLNDDIYTVLCDKCPFQQTFDGIPPLNPELLVMAGLPEKLADYMEVYCEDVDKIIRFAAHDLFLKHCINGELNGNLEILERCIKSLSENMHASDSSRLQFAKSENLTNECTEVILQMKTEFETATSDIDADYKKNVVDILAKIDNFQYPEDIFKVEIDY